MVGIIVLFIYIKNNNYNNKNTFNLQNAWISLELVPCAHAYSLSLSLSLIYRYLVGALSRSLCVRVGSVFFVVLRFMCCILCVWPKYLKQKCSGNS